MRVRYPTRIIFRLEFGLHPLFERTGWLRRDVGVVKFGGQFLQLDGFKSFVGVPPFLRILSRDERGHASGDVEIRFRQLLQLDGLEPFVGVLSFLFVLEDKRGHSSGDGEGCLSRRCFSLLHLSSCRIPFSFA